MAPTMTEDDNLTFHIMRENPWADWLVDQYILYKWPYYGWVVGRVVRRYLSREVEIPPGHSPTFRCTKMWTSSALTITCHSIPTILTKVKKLPTTRGSGSLKTLIRLGGMRQSAER